MIDKIEKVLRGILSEKGNNDLIIEEKDFGYSAKIGSSVLLRIFTDKKSFYRVMFLNNEDLESFTKKYTGFVKKIAEVNNDKIVSFQIDCERIDKELINLISSLSEIIKEQENYLLNRRFFNSFACCSHYLECSKEKKCIMLDIDYEFYKGCEYKKSLEKGKIFY